MQYPHEFSGGMKQRAVIALALICYPKILIADEPTTALDVVAQRQVIELLIDLQKELNLSMILISHDISAVAEACEKIAVMYGGEIMEIGPTRDVLIRNNHPYTNALVGSFPSLHKPISKLTQIPGSPLILLICLVDVLFILAVHMHKIYAYMKNHQCVQFVLINYANVILQKNLILISKEMI